MKPGCSPEKPAKETSTVPEPDLKEALRQSEATYHGLFNTIRQAIYIQDPGGRFVDVNDGSCVMYGYTREEFIGRTPEFLAAPGLNDFAVLSEKSRLAFIGVPQQMEFWGKRKNGEIFPKEIRLCKGTYFGRDVLIVVATDITGQKQTEKALRESESHYRAIVDTVPDSITITDLRGKILMVSPASIAMFGLTVPDAAIDKSILEFIVPEEEKQVRMAMALLIKTGTALGEFHGKRSDGTIFPLEVHASLMRDRQGNPWHLVMVVRDISLRRHLEDTLSSALSRSHKQQRVIAGIAASPLISSGNVEDLARQITERAAPVLGVERAGVWIFDEPETRLTCIDLFASTPGTHTSEEVLLEAEFRPEFAALKSATFIDAADPLTDPRTSGYVESYVKPLGITSMLDAVVRIAGKNLGLLCFEHVGKQHRWEPDEITFACQLADQIALAMTNRQRNKVQQELFESEAKFRFLTEKMNDIVWTVDLRFHTTYVSPSVEKILGFTPEERMQQDVTRQLTPESLRLVRMLLARELENEQQAPRDPDQALVIPLEYYHKNKSSVWLECMISGIHDEHGVLTGIHGVSRDITGRKRVEEALRVSQQRFQGLIETLYDWVWEVDSRGYFTYASPRVTDVLGYEPEELPGKMPFDFMNPEEAQRVSKIFRQIVKDRAPILAMENTCLHKDGHKVIMETSGLPFHDAKGNLKGYRGTNRDITGRKHIEAALIESESFNRSLVENLPEYIAVYGKDGKLLYVNPASARGLGYDADTLIGTHVLTYVADEYHALVTAKMTARWGSGDTSPYEIDMVTKNGSRRSVIVKATPIQYQNHPAILLLLIDITERKKVELALTESEKLFREVFNNANDAVFLHELTPEGPGNYILVNDVALSWLGYTREELMQMSPQDIVPEEIGQKIMPKIMDQLSDWGHATFESVHRRKDQSTYPVEVSTHMFSLKNRTVALSTARDISRRKQGLDTLRESERRYRHLLTAITDYVYSVRVQDGRAVDTEYGPGCEAVTGYTTRDFRADPELWIRMVVEEDRALVSSQAESILAGRVEVRAIEHRIVHKDGGIRWVRNTPLLRYDPKGTLIGYDGLVQDVTDRKRVELALLTSEAQLNAIIRASPIPTFVIDNHHRVISWNKALEKTTGTESRTMLGTSIHWKAFYPNARPCMADILVDGALEQIPELYADRWKKSEIVQGALEATDFFPNMGMGGKWLHFMAAPIIDSAGNLVGVVETLEDITHLVQAQQELKDSEERYRTLIDQLPDYVIVHRDGILLYVNPSAASRMGYDAATLIGKPALQFIAPEYHETVRKVMAQRMTGKGSPSYEVKISGGDGASYTVLVNGAIINYGGKPAILNVLTDITAIKKAEEAIRSANEDLDKRVTERTEALIMANEHLVAEIAARSHAEREITSSLHEKNLLLREIHHRVKNNLQIIASLLNLQSRYITDARVQESIKETQSRVRAMALAHEQIYRSDNISDINLNTYLNYLTKQIFQLYNIQRYQIGLTVTMGDVMANLDTVIPVGLIINELVSNSLKHAFPDGRRGMISLTCTPEGTEKLRLVYTDNGVGMPDGFDWKNTETLGLRLVNGLVSQLNGTIVLEPGEGTTFVIEIMKNSAGKSR